MRGRLTESQQALAVQYLPMARSLAKPFKAQLPDAWDEFESAACLALVEAARSFDPSIGVKFSTFARIRIWGGLCDARRHRLARGWKADPTAHGPGLVGLPSDPEAHGRVLLMAEPEPVGSELEAVEEVEAWLRKLPRSHAAACRLIYLHGKTHAEAGAALGLSPSRVTFMHLEALAMLGGTWTGRGGAPRRPRRERERRSAPCPS